MLERDFWCARPLRTEPLVFSRFLIEASFLRLKDRLATRPQRSPACTLDDEGSFLQIAMKAQIAKNLRH
jgi:hypothetical protein